jgi:hypothetical protein
MQRSRNALQRQRRGDGSGGRGGSGGHGDFAFLANPGERDPFSHSVEVSDNVAEAWEVESDTRTASIPCSTLFLVLMIESRAMLNSATGSMPSKSAAQTIQLSTSISLLTTLPVVSA